ncbi:hypothetical protein ACFQZ4_45830 [Catellatospora coxensis]
MTLVRADPAVLQQCADFPVERAPRPIVLMGDSRIRVQGFTTDNAKIALMQGKLALETTLPAGPSTVEVNLTDGTFTLPAISAEQAYDVIVAAGDPGAVSDVSPAPLRITKIALGTAEFRTDRGRLTLPAWLFTAAESTQPLAVPMLAEAAFWRPGEPNLGEPGAASIAADGMTLTVQLMKTPDPCPGMPTEQFEAEVAESTTAVAIGLRLVESSPAATPGRRQGGCLDDLVYRTQPYTVRLARPLGNRVLVGRDGASAVTKG